MHLPIFGHCKTFTAIQRTRITQHSLASELSYPGTGAHDAGERIFVIGEKLHLQLGSEIPEITALHYAKGYKIRLLWDIITQKAYIWS